MMFVLSKSANFIFPEFSEGLRIRPTNAALVDPTEGRIMGGEIRLRDGYHRSAEERLVANVHSALVDRRWQIA